MKKYIGFITVFACIYFTSCKENTILSTNLIPKVDNINTFFTDTFTTIMSNVAYDSVKTSTNSNSNRYAALGVISGDGSGDPIFGKTVASIALQFRQPSVAITFPKNLMIDSMVLSIPYVRTYGDTIVGGNQTFNVYRLSNAPSKDSSYYIKQQLPYNSADILGSVSVNLKKMDSVVLRAGKQEPQLRVALDTNLARILVGLKDSVEYKSYRTFIDYFKGLYIAPSDTNTGNMIGYFDYSLAKVVIYTHGGASATDSNTYAFGFDEATCVHQNKITRNYTDNSPLIGNFLNTNNPAGDSILFLQSEGGSSIKITLPNIHKFPNVIVNKAELEFTVLSTGNAVKDSLYRPISLMRATGINALNADYILSGDYAITSTGGIGKVVNDGFRSTEIENGVTVYKYKVSLTKTIQKAISEKNSDLKIRLTGFNGLIASGRSLIGGSNRISQKAKINIIYTKIK